MRAQHSHSFAADQGEPYRLTLEPVMRTKNRTTAKPHHARILGIGVALALLAGTAHAQKAGETTKAQIDYRGFKTLTSTLDSYRSDRLISLDDFKRMAREPNTIILDARSASAYARGHLRGAINLPFTDFTAAALRDALGTPNVRILIYCNNNFSNNAQPVILKSAPLALNIPTFINLVGYGYRNVYELGEVIDFNSPQVEWVRG
jgi:phage shock protein E